MPPLNIDQLKVFIDDDVTFAELPDAAGLDDETLDLWQLTTLTREKTPILDECEPASERYARWEAEITAEWLERRSRPANDNTSRSL